MVDAGTLFYASKIKAEVNRPPSRPCNEISTQIGEEEGFGSGWSEVGVSGLGDGQVQADHIGNTPVAIP